jgi:predicted molibdopterin-dependent oxidoreductase YjgC
VESGGSFTNTQKIIQEFEAQFKPAVERLSWQQMSDLITKLGHAGHESPKDVISEALSLLPVKSEEYKFSFNLTENDNPARHFRSGCDNLVMRFEEEFLIALN